MSIHEKVTFVVALSVAIGKAAMSAVAAKVQTPAVDPLDID
jgi:hypothetical protein